MCLGLCLHKEYREERGGAKAIDLYVLSRSIYLKPACNLVKTAQRKSQLNPTATLLEHALLTQGFMGRSKAGFLHILQPQNRDSTRANLANTQK